MKKLYPLAILLSLFVLAMSPKDLRASTYYVTQNGSGNGSGSSYTNSMSISSHNSNSLSPGDTIYLCDTITSTVIVPSSGSSGKYITYRGDYAGHAGKIDRNGGSNGIVATAKDYLIFQGIEITDFSADAGILFYNGCDYIIVWKCTIHDSSGSSRGIFSTSPSGGTRNTHITVGGGNGDGNTIYNIGSTTAASNVMMNKTTTWTISYNQLYGTGTNGVDGIMTQEAVSGIIEYNKIHGNYREDGIDIKVQSHDIIIRYNDIYDHPNQTGITVQMDSNTINIFGNRIHNNGTGILIFDHATSDYPNCNSITVHDVNVWSNLIYLNDNDGVWVSKYDGYTNSCSPEDPENIRIYNNVIAENGTTSGYGVRISYGTGNEVKNNIFYKNRSDYVQAYYALGTSETFDYNYYYWPSHTSYVYYSGGKQPIAILKGTYRQETNGADNDPKMKDPTNNDYTLQSASPCIDTGTDLGSNYDEAMDPTQTNFRNAIPFVVTANQRNYGAWERGAYIYNQDDGGTSISPPVNLIVIPAPN